MLTEINLACEYEDDTWIVSFCLNGKWYTLPDEFNSAEEALAKVKEAAFALAEATAHPLHDVQPQGSA